MGGKLGSGPLSDAAFENGHAIAAGDQIRGGPLGDELAGVRVVQNDVAICREKRAIN